MDAKTPVVLVVLADLPRLRWFVAELGLDGTVSPLLRSGEGDLAAYQGQPFDEQVSFLRHRFCGVIQRGCDRLWPAGKKACQFVYLLEGNLPGTEDELTLRVAEHFAVWMLNPPVFVAASSGGFGNGAAPALTQLAGTIDAPLEKLLHASLASLFAAAADPDAWELSQRKGTWQPSNAPS